MEQTRLKSGNHTEIMRHFEIRIERPKPSALDELLVLLRKILHYCLCAVTCGCVPPPRSDNGLNGHELSTVLLDNEKRAVEDLLTYLETETDEDLVIMPQHLQALSILTYSDNEDLQRSAALCYIEFSEKVHSPLRPDMIVPLCELLKSSDQQVQKAASLAVSNFSLSPPENKDVLISCGVMPALVKLLSSSNAEIQCNICGSIAALAPADNSMQQLVAENGIKPLLSLLTSPDVRVQRNATGALLNMTHSQINRNSLVGCGALPVLVEVLHSPDEEVQYYCAAALSNIAVHEKHRTMMVAVGNNDIVHQMINLLFSRNTKIKCQACFALRNLASDSDQQVLLVRHGILEALHKVIQQVSASRLPPAPDMLAAAVGCLRNLSILKANELSIVSEDFLPDLCTILVSGHNAEAQRHAAGTIRNIAVGDLTQMVLEADCVEALCKGLLDIKTRSQAHADITAAIAVLADEDDVRDKLIKLWDGRVFGRLVSLASLSSNSEVQYNCAGILGQLALYGIPTNLAKINRLGIVLYIDKFVKSSDSNFTHIGLWTLNQLLKDDLFVQAFKEHHIDHLVCKMLKLSQPPAIMELLDSVQEILLEEEEEEEEEQKETTPEERETT